MSSTADKEEMIEARPGAKTASDTIAEDPSDWGIMFLDHIPFLSSDTFFRVGIYYTSYCTRQDSP